MEFENVLDRTRLIFISASHATGGEAILALNWIDKAHGETGDKLKAYERMMRYSLTNRTNKGEIK